MHWRESSLRKASNTAKLVPMLLKDGGIVAAGDVAAEARYRPCNAVIFVSFRFFDSLCANSILVTLMDGWMDGWILP